MNPNCLLSCFTLIGLICMVGGPVVAQSDAPGSQPNPVRVGVMVLDIYKIDDIEETVRGEFVLFANWQDSSFRAPELRDPVRVPLEEVNAPRIQVKNLQEIETFNRRMVQVSPDGTVNFRHRFIGELHQPFDFRRFPFDSQLWTITLFFSGGENFQIIPDEVYQGLMAVDSLSITSWKIRYLDQESSLLTNYGFPIQTIEIRYELTRDPVFYIWKVVIPIILVVFMSWSVFWINPSNISAQLTVSVTAILTLIAFQFSVAQLMPPLPYLTKLDRFTVGADIFVFLAFVETIVTSYTENKGRITVSEKIDYYARFLFPATFGGFVLLTLW